MTAAKGIQEQLLSSAETVRQMALEQAETLAQIAEHLIAVLSQGRKVLLCGNGGSAADAQHVATELVARYKVNRRSLPAIALGTDVTYLTAMGNDYDFSHVFARQVEGFGHQGDLLWAFSTSGTSPNVLAAAETARHLRLDVIAFTGATGGKLKPLADHCLCVASVDTPRIQEAHMAAAHAICDLVELAFIS